METLPSQEGELRQRIVNAAGVYSKFDCIEPEERVILQKRLAEAIESAFLDPS
jgi:hypothetical protein